jgi:tripartite-type tricarboxylate transporter receptor subunit TctC
MKRRTHVAAAIFAALLGATGAPVVAQTTGGKQLRIIVPFPPGGTADILTRVVGQEAARAIGQSLLVENRPGGGTVIATEIASRAAPDGNTLLTMANSFVISALVRESLPYHPLTSFAPICLLALSPQLLTVNAASEFRSLPDFMNALRQRPGELSIATVGPATTQHIGIEVFRRAAQVNFIYVPYPGGAPAVNALLGQHVNAVLTNYSELVEQLNAGTLRPLAVASLKRLDELPNVPALAETYKDYQTVAWFGMVAPAGTPKDAISRLSTALTAALEVPEIKTKLLGLGLYPSALCGDGFGTHIRSQHEEYSTVIRAANIKGE